MRDANFGNSIIAYAKIKSKIWENRKYIRIYVGYTCHATKRLILTMN